MRYLGLILFLASGCAGLDVTGSPGQPVASAHSGGHELRVLDLESPLRQRRHIPVLSTPEVFAAYVPSHVRESVLVGEHWVFFKLGEAEWYIERIQDPDPPVDGPAHADQLKPLRSLESRGVVVPHRSTP